LEKARSRFNSKAFSLLEVVIAVGVLSVGIVFILQAESFSARVTGISGDMANAVFLAQDLMQEIEFQEQAGQIIEGSKSGESAKFKWNYSISTEGSLGLDKLNLVINWERAGRKEELDLATYLLKHEI
jgi:Tfp pilus assembly protein PilV